tara:strand:+ start:326 stop:880 length:555 start_codon:yes stop_codon:yes gene_type:complete
MIKNKTLLFKVLILFMIFFNNANANYDKKFYDHQIQTIDGNNQNLNIYKNKVVLLVNTASYCGFTKQYEDLQKIWDKYKNKNFVVLGVPSNSFNQEKTNEKDIKEFCTVNFNINFPMTAIYDVKGENAHEIYKWAKNNHGKSAVPKWNFHKILINKYGTIEDTFSSFTNPGSGKIIKKLENLLD